MRQLGLEHFINELVPLPPVVTVVAGIVEFDTALRFHRGRIEQQKVNVLAVDLVPVGVVLVGAHGEENVAHVDLRAHDRPPAHGPR